MNPIKTVKDWWKNKDAKPAAAPEETGPPQYTTDGRRLPLQVKDTGPQLDGTLDAATKYLAKRKKDQDARLKQIMSGKD